MDERFTVESTWRLAESLWRDGEFTEARRVARLILQGGEARRDVVIGTSVMLGIIEQSCDLHASVKTLEHVAPLISVCHDPVLVGKWWNTLAVTRSKARDYDGALKGYESGLECHRRAGAMLYACQTTHNIGTLFLRLDQPDIARPYIERAIRECEDEITLAQFRATEARLLCAEREYDRAEEVAAESAEFLQMMGETTFCNESLKTLGEIRLAMRRARVRR